MCGRFTLAAELDAVAETFAVDARLLAAGYRPHWNVAPGQEALVVAGGAGGRQAAFVRWGFGAGPGAPPGRGPWINARSESVGSRPAFRESFRRRRRLVPADGFFEWAGRGRRRQPYWVRPVDGLFAMAGIQGEAGPGSGVAVLTRAAPERLEWLHPRVPVILPPDTWDVWLSGAESGPALRSALESASPELLAHPVSRAVNDARVDEPACIAEVAAACEEQRSLL